VIVVLLGLLGLLAFLQFRWINDVTTAERERMQAHLRAAAERLVQEFDRELMRACLVFLMAPFEWNEDNSANIAERYRSWSQIAPSPRLVRNVYLATGQSIGGPALRRFDPQANRLATVPWPSGLSPLRSRLDELFEGSSPESRSAPRPVRWTIEEEIPALVLLISHGFPRQMPGPVRPSFTGEGSADVLGALILDLDLEFLQKEILPQVTRKHLSGPGGFDYEVAVVSARDPKRFLYLSPGASQSSFRAPDLNVALLALRTEDANTLSPLLALERTEPFGGGSRGGRGPRADWPPNRGRGLALQSIQPGIEGRWRLLLTHRSGSLESAVAGLRSRSLAIGFAILLLLAASVGLIIVLTQRAQRLARLQAEFLAGISHELLTPLAVIRSAADNLADGVADTGEQAQRYGEMIRRQSRRLSEMVQDALGFAVAHSPARGRFRSMDVGEVIRRAVETCRPAIVEARVELAEVIEPELPPIQGDATALSHALRNLLMNGLQYGSDGGWLSIRAHKASGRHGPEIEIVVEDRGQGVEPGDLSRIFEPFYRGRTAAVSRLHGTGLGLSLVKRIAEDHGGHVSVKAARPKGTVFSLRLPATRSREQEQ
jgi:signal transduction histidine kinase